MNDLGSSPLTPGEPAGLAGSMDDDIPIRQRPERFNNRELSWLDFNTRVLAQAEDPTMPLLERLKFLAIQTTNLDEFFQVRVAGLRDRFTAGSARRSSDGRSPNRQLNEIRERVVAQNERLANAYSVLRPLLHAEGVEILDYEDLALADRRALDEEFRDRMFPLITPLAVDPGHPFPYISNLSLSLGVVLRDPLHDQRRFARIKVPDDLGRFLELPEGERFVPIEQVIAAHLPDLFPGLEVTDHVAFRVTRNAGLDIDEEEANDLMSAVQTELRRRRFGSVCRVEIQGDRAPEFVRLLVRELDVDDRDVYSTSIPLGLEGLWAIHGVDRSDLRDPEFAPVIPTRLRGLQDESIFAVLKRGDVMMQHPYDSFNDSVQEFLWQAANDSKVRAIKMTLYRTSGDTEIVDALIHAAEEGKQVAVVVELKARFDEENNIRWARRLEQAGVHVAYGLVGLKVHSKTCLVVRDEAAGFRFYSHIGTGNYNSKTARIYEDLGVLTADPAIGSDLMHLFNSLTGYGRDVDYQRLIVAPQYLRQRLADLVRGEIAKGPDGCIVLKLNSLADSAMIDLLYDASAAGVQIDLIVRGICCLRPGVPGLSENIRVQSLVGRYLEHSRIYFFANGGADGGPIFLTGSADLMQRNLDRRVEVLLPIEDHEQKLRMAEILQLARTDDVLSWTLNADGAWTRVQTVEGLNLHEQLQEAAVPG